MGKGEIARYEQFLLFRQCFQKASFPGASKGVIVWEWVNVGKYLPERGMFRKNNECRKAQVIFADVSRLRQIFPPQADEINNNALIF